MKPAIGLIVNGRKKGRIKAGINGTGVTRKVVVKCQLSKLKKIIQNSKEYEIQPEAKSHGTRAQKIFHSAGRKYTHYIISA